MPKVRVNAGRHLIFCPGCKHAHVFDNRWPFNGDVEKPTFIGSLLVSWKHDDMEHVCHSVVTDGNIRFIDDGTTHELRGQTVPLEDFHF